MGVGSHEPFPPPRGPAGDYPARRSSMWLHVSCSLEFELAEATSFIFMLRPRSGSQQWVAREQYIFLPSVPAAEFTDGFGNLCQRLEAPAGAFAVHTAADIQAEDACDEAPGAAFVPVGQLPE